MKKQKIDNIFIGKRIELLSEFNLDNKGINKQLCWCAGTVEQVSDGTWVMPGKRSKCFKGGEAAQVRWGEIPDADLPKA